MLRRSTQGVVQRALVLKRAYSSDAGEAKKKAAVILSGCGVYDGTEVTEAVSLMVQLSQRDIPFDCFAPNRPQTEVVDHATGKRDANDDVDFRNCLVESMRITRGQTNALSTLNANDFNSLFVPGGFGAAKNLSTYALDGNDLEVDADVARVIKDFHSQNKPMGFACIAPILAAKVLGETGVSVTLGPNGSAHQAVSEISEKNTAVEKGVLEVESDSSNGVYSTPAYMTANPTPAQVFAGMGNLVDAVLAAAGLAKDVHVDDAEQSKFFESLHLETGHRDQTQ